MRRRDVLAQAALVAVVALAGCDDFSRFSTGPGEAYCGSVTLGAAFRAGLSPRVQMRLELDASRLDRAEPPGTISTFEAADDATPERRVLDAAPLRPIPPLAHDPLSHLEFGEGRERNLIYAVSPADPEADAMLAIVSLRSDDTIEVRLMRPGPTLAEGEAAPVGRRSIFGIFPLERQSGQCGF